MVDDLTKRVASLDPAKLKLLIAEVAQKKATSSPTTAISPTTLQGSSPLSYAQQRLWFLAQLVPDNPFYNVPLVLRLAGRVDAAALERSLREILVRHEALRTTFLQEQAQPVQFIRPPSELPSCLLPVIDLGGLPPARCEQQVHHLIAEEGRRAFDLSRELPLRAWLLRLSEQDRKSVV